MKKNIFMTFLLIASLTSLPVCNCAPDLAPIYATARGEGETLKLYMGQNKIIPASNPSRIAIGNPAVADVIQVTKEEIALAPKAPGTTTLIFWDNYGEQSFVVKVFAEDVLDIKRRVENLLAKLKLKDLMVKAEEDEGKVFLTGKVRNQKDKDQMAIVLATLKDKIIDLTSVKDDETVIEIDVQVLELDKGASSTLGFTWPASINITEVGSPALVASPVTAVGGLTTTGGTAVGTRWGALFKVPFATRDAFSVKIDTLIQEGKARVLSRPRISCLSGKEAKLLVGGEVPVLSATLSSGGSTGTGGPAATPGNVEYKEYGITLKINPTVQPDRRIHLGMLVEVSELGDTVQTDYALAYTFNKRNANTELYLTDGETMAIGGLIKQRTEEDLRKFPWLADLPILGLFFRQKKTFSGGGVEKKSDTELFITLTPHIVREAKEVVEEEEINVKEELQMAAMRQKKELPLDPVSKYTQLIQDRIQEKLAYPEQAKDAGFQGTTRLGLRLSYRGELLDVGLKDSSGYKILDDNALLTAKRISPYPPFPAAIEEEELSIEIPITYKMN